MKLKKLFAGIVAVAMMATMAMPSFAAGDSASSVWGSSNGKKHQVDDNGQVKIQKEYKLEGEGTSPNETFNFDITKYSVSNSSIKETTDTKMPVPSVSSAAYTGEGDHATAAGLKKDIVIDFGTGENFIYKDAGVGIYGYEITEKKPDKPTAGVTYDSTPVYMKVTVVNNSTYTGYEIQSVTFHKAGKKLGEGDAAFENKYSAAKLLVEKEVKGNMGNKNEYFDFEITLNAADTDTKTYNTTYTLTGGKYTGESAETLTLGQKKDVQLKHGDVLTIENLPYGMTYTVTEKDYVTSGAYDKTEYEYYVGDDKVTTPDYTVKGTVDKVKVINTKGDVIDTGVILDNAPYIALLTIVAAGAVFMIIKKRRNYED